MQGVPKKLDKLQELVLGIKIKKISSQKHMSTNERRFS